MEVYRVEGTYTQGGDTERFRGELGVEGATVKGQIDDIDQDMIIEPDRNDLRNKVVEGEAYPVEGQLYMVKREFSHALRNLDRNEEGRVTPQEVHVVAETPEEGLEGEYNGVWTMDRPGELPVEYLGTEDFELGWDIPPEQYETHDRSAEELIEEMYDGELPEEPEEINTEREISRGTTNFHVERLEDQERAEEGLPLDVVNVALNGGVDDERRIA